LLKRYKNLGSEDNMLAYGECFRCKGLAVVDKTTLDHLPKLLYKAANTLEWAKESAEGIGDYDEWKVLIIDLKAAAMLLDMMPND
jgi:hypothetical protein